MTASVGRVESHSPRAVAPGVVRGVCVWPVVDLTWPGRFRYRTELRTYLVNVTNILTQVLIFLHTSDPRDSFIHQNGALTHGFTPYSRFDASKTTQHTRRYRFKAVRFQDPSIAPSIQEPGSIHQSAPTHHTAFHLFTFSAAWPRRLPPRPNFSVYSRHPIACTARTELVRSDPCICTDHPARACTTTRAFSLPAPLMRRLSVWRIAGGFALWSPARRRAWLRLKLSMIFCAAAAARRTSSDRPSSIAPLRARRAASARCSRSSKCGGQSERALLCALGVVASRIADDGLVSSTLTSTRLGRNPSTAPRAAAAAASAFFAACAAATAAGFCPTPGGTLGFRST